MTDWRGSAPAEARHAGRSWAGVAVAGLAMAATCVALGAGYALTPATGDAGSRRFAPWDASLDAWVGLAGVAGGALLAATTLAFARRVRRGWSTARLLPAAVAVGAFAVADAAGLWVWATAEPPLPPSWAWLRAVHWAGLGLAAVWAVVAVVASVAARRGVGTAR